MLKTQTKTQNFRTLKIQTENIKPHNTQTQKLVCLTLKPLTQTLGRPIRPSKSAPKGRLWVQLTPERLAHTSPSTGAKKFRTDGNALDRTEPRVPVTASPRARGRQPHASRQGWHPHRLWPVTRVEGSPSSSRPRWDADPGAASTHITEDRSPGSTYGQLLHCTGLNPWSP